jgi:rhodanese-related sulfurtransferase
MHRNWFMTITFLALFAFSMKGQNKWGFETMVNTLISNTVDTISSERLEELLLENDPIVLDAREPSEYEVSHIEGALNIGYQNPSFDMLEGMDKSKPVVVYCSVGKRSEDIGAQLKQKGFENVYNLFGGVFDWTNRGYTVVDKSGHEVKKVHPYNAAWGIWVNNYEKDYGSK